MLAKVAEGRNLCAIAGVSDFHRFFSLLERANVASEDYFNRSLSKLGYIVLVVNYI